MVDINILLNNVETSLIKKYFEKEYIMYEDNKVIFINQIILESIINDLLLNNKKDSIYFIKALKNNADKKYYEFLYYINQDNFNKAHIKLLELDIINSNKYKHIILLFRALLENKEINIEDIKLNKYDNEYYDNIVEIIKKYISKKQFGIVSHFMNYILDIDDSIFNRTLLNIISKLKYKCNYIVDSTSIDNEVVLNAMRKREIDFLSYIELEDYTNAGTILSDLRYMYENNYKLDVIQMLLMNLRKIRKNTRMVSKRNLLGVVGELDGVLLSLLKEGDLYRVNTLINDAVNEDEFSISNMVYKILIDRIMFYNKRNMNYIERELFLNLNGTKNDDEVLAKYNINSLNVDHLKAMESEDDDIDINVNYYKLYLNYYNNKKYIEAKEALIKFKKKLSSLNIFKDVEYLLKELDILIENENDDADKVNKCHNLYDVGLRKFNSGNYVAAYRCFKELIDNSKNPNPKIWCLIGDSLFNLGFIDDALDIYLGCEGVFLSPEHYLSLIECFFIKEDYDNVIKYAPKYEYYYPGENCRLHYMLSISYASIGDFDSAIDELGICNFINNTYNNIYYEYEDEAAIINKLKNGENVKMYTIDDFVDFTLNDRDINLEDSILNMNSLDVLSKSSEYELLESKIDYLLSVAKIYFYSGKVDDCLLILSTLENTCKSTNEEEKVNKQLNAYRFNLKR